MEGNWFGKKGMAVQCNNLKGTGDLVLDQPWTTNWGYFCCYYRWMAILWYHIISGLWPFCVKVDYKVSLTDEMAFPWGFFSSVLFSWEQINPIFSSYYWKQCGWRAFSLGGLPSMLLFLCSQRPFGFLLRTPLHSYKVSKCSLFIWTYCPALECLFWSN